VPLMIVHESGDGSMKITRRLPVFAKFYILAWIILFGSTIAVLGQTESAAGRVAISKEAMATTAHPLATQAAIEMLHKGGNAIDAAVAAAFAIGVVEPDGSGLGGGGGMVIYLAKEKKSVYINYYQRASEKINEINYNPASDNRSAKAILVPGTVAGLTMALERYGTLPLATVLEPAIRYAGEGFPIDETLGKIILDNAEFLQKYPQTAATFLREGFPLTQGDTVLQPDLANTLRAIAANGRAGFYEGPVAQTIVNDVVQNGGMVTLNDFKNYQAVISEPLHGKYRDFDILSADAPQSGSSILEGLNILENADLKSMGHYANSTETMHLMAEAIRRVYADRSAFLDDPQFEYVPVKGLISKDYARNRYDDIDRNIVSPSDYRKTKAGNPFGADGSNAPQRSGNSRVSEDKNYQWNDVDEEGVSVKRSSDDLFDRWGGTKKHKKDTETEDTTQKNNKNKLDKEKKNNNDDSDDPPEARNKPRNRYLPDNPAMPYVQNDAASLASAYDPNPGEGGHTTHLSVVDKYGNAVSLTQTLGTFFGSGLSTAGVILNCSMSNFSATTAVNSVKPNKQPRSSIAPTIVLKDGMPYLTVGSPGATRIIATVIELIVNVLDFGMSVDEANNAPRFLCQKNDDYLSLESRISETVQEGLKKKGHRLKLYGDLDLFFGGAQMILYDRQTGTYYGSADPRRGGAAIGD
jgi:gamma-glutamyltranspeptidase